MALRSRQVQWGISSRRSRDQRKRWRMRWMKSPGGIRGMPREPSVMSRASARPEAANSATKASRAFSPPVPRGGSSSTLTANWPVEELAREWAIAALGGCVGWLLVRRPCQLDDALPGRKAVEVVVHLVDVGGVDLAATADEAHALVRHFAGKAPHALGVDARQVAMTHAPELAAVGHDRELDLAVAHGCTFLRCVEEGPALLRVNSS